MDRIVDISESFGLSLNISKTKYMVISKKQNLREKLLISGQQIEKVQKYKYLGTLVNEDCKHGIEVKCRIEMAREAFVKMSKMLKCHDFSLGTKIRILKCYIFPILLYGAETWTLTDINMDINYEIWTLTETLSKKILALEMWLFRRILNISWTDRVSNVCVLQRMQKEKELLNTIKTRQLEYLGHIMRNNNRYGFLQLILPGKIEDKRSLGRRRISWLKNLRDWFSTTSIELFHSPIEKEAIFNMISNI